VKEKPTIAQHTICGKSFKNVGKAFQVKLVERMPRVCKAVIKAKVGYFVRTTLPQFLYGLPLNSALQMSGSD
jgi:hypothetical protein